MGKPQHVKQLNEQSIMADYDQMFLLKPIRISRLLETGDHRIYLTTDFMTLRDNIPRVSQVLPSLSNHLQTNGLTRRKLWRQVFCFVHSSALYSPVNLDCNDTAWETDEYP